MFRRIVTGVTLGAGVCAVLGLVGGCLTRPVEAADPITKTNFITSIPQGSIDKVDLLFDIDNSASMGDKQAYLSKAIPDLISRLVQPNCLDATGAIKGMAGLDGSCSDPTATAEFPPVHNLHIGIVSSSLGSRLGDACLTTGPNATQPLAGGGTIDRHNDDQAHLLSRGANPMNLTDYTETPVGAAQDNQGDNFLDWFPTPAENPANTGKTPTGPTPVTDPMALQNDFQQLVVGVHQFGCGIESQLETWYRFLIQPDPYASLTTKMYNGQKIAEWVGVDTTILQQRADFLRPDSLVAILVLTDENDSEVDVRSFSGTGWNFMSTSFQPPRGTSDCQNNPGSMTCTSCGFPGHGGDSSCKMGNYSSVTDWGYDLNLRHVHEKQKYGVSVQFPIQRYVLGLTSPKVPNRDGEYPPDGKGGYASSYQGTDPAQMKCVNPLYAKKLPTPPSGSSNWMPTTDQLCNLQPGTRKPGLIYYAHIGGIPHQLIQQDPSNPDSPQKANLTDDDWTLILGKDPENFDYTGIDPHMVESYNARTGVPMPPKGFAVSAPPATAASMATLPDPIAGYEWVTDSTMAEHQGLRVDREYACIFKLEQPRACDDGATKADPTLTDSCDCQPPQSMTGSFTPQQVPAVCNGATPTQQDYAKTYPTIRELEVARLLGKVNGANEGIISSLCPIHTTEMGSGDPLYGYRPAMNAIIDKLKTSLGLQCLPQRLSIEGDGGTAQVQCLVLGTFPSGNGAPATCKDVPGGGYGDPDPQVIQHFHNDQHAQWVQGGMLGDDPSQNLTCELKQLPANQVCNTKTSNDGWCYVQDNMVKGCAQAILFSPNALTAGVTTSLQCIEASNTVIGSGM